MEDKSLIQLAEEFLIYKKSNGYIYLGGEYYLKKYMAFSLSISPNESVPSKRTVEAFIDQYADVPGSLYNAVAVIREFERYLFSRNYTGVYIIPSKRVALPTPVQPYFFTGTEISFFLKNAIA